MGSIILDDCLTALYEAQEYMKDYRPVSEYQAIFEASKPEVAAQMQQNAQVELKSESAIIRAIKAVKSFINSLITGIADFFRMMNMDNGEYAAFKEFKEKVKQDPSLANKKVTVQDFRKLDAEYQSVIADIDKKIREVKANEQTPIEELVNKAEGMLKRGITDVGIVVTADAARKLAESNMTAAGIIDTALKSDNGLMDELINTMGKHRAKKFEKSIHMYSKVTMLTRLKAKIFKKRYSFIQNANKGIAQELSSLKSDVSSALKKSGENLLHAGVTKGNKKAGTRTDMRMANDLAHTKTGKSVLKTVGKTGAFVGANATKGAIKAGADNTVYGTKEKVKKSYRKMVDTLRKPGNIKD